jgi:imidazole glycerol phosphate synthase glutamine amidotransferase subunit
VGAFGSMMKNLRSKRLDKAIVKVIWEGKPFLGICLGLQALFENSEESEGVAGLAVFKGEVVRFKKGKVPQIGWNNLKVKREGLLRSGFYYFANSYYAVPEDERIVSGTTDYFGEFASAIQYRNITAVQFHPEKSGKSGMEFLARWLKC